MKKSLHATVCDIANLHAFTDSSSLSLINYTNKTSCVYHLTDNLRLASCVSPQIGGNVFASAVSIRRLTSATHTHIIILDYSGGLSLLAGLLPSVRPPKPSQMSHFPVVHLDGYKSMKIQYLEPTIN